MWRSLVLLLLALLSLMSMGSQGLQFELDLGLPSSHGSRLPCGVLTCSEDVSLNSATNAATPEAQNISNLTIYKIVSDALTSEPALNDSGAEILLARVTEAENNVSILTERVVVLGLLRASRASLRVELFLQEECGAQTFVCQSHTMDSRSDHVHANRLVTRSVAGNQHAANEIGTHLERDDLLQFVDSTRGRSSEWAPEATMHVISLIEQLQVKLVAIEGNVDRIKEEVQDKDLLEQVIKEQLSTLLGARDGGLNPVRPTLPDEITSDEMFVAKILSGLKSELEQFRKDLIDTLAHHLETTTENESPHASCPPTSEDSERATAKLMRKVDQWFANISSAFSAKLNIGFHTLEQGMRDTLHNLVLPLTNQSAVCNQVPRELQNLEALVGDVSNPSSCKKDDLHVAFQAVFPYLVVKPDQPGNIAQTPILCETHTLGGGWIVIQRRSTGNENFYRGWYLYRKGFGSLSDDFWLGLESIYQITKSGTYELRIDLKFKDKVVFAHYATFSIAEEREKYALLIGSYDGTAGDSLNIHRGMAFSTYDKDHDKHSTNCAQKYSAGWWYNKCHDANLNGKWLSGKNFGPRWKSLSGDAPVSFSEMKIRRIN